LLAFQHIDHRSLQPLAAVAFGFTSTRTVSPCMAVLKSLGRTGYPSPVLHDNEAHPRPCDLDHAFIFVKIPCLFFPGFFEFFLPISGWLFKIFMNLITSSVKVIFLLEKEFVFDGNDIKWHAIDLLPELQQPHGVFFRGQDEFFSIFYGSEPFFDVLPVVDGEYMMVVIVHHIISMNPFFQDNFQRTRIGNAGNQQHLGLLININENHAV
jgi:hypothetical protein